MNFNLTEWVQIDVILKQFTILHSKKRKGIGDLYAKLI